MASIPRGTRPASLLLVSGLLAAACGSVRGEEGGDALRELVRRFERSGRIALPIGVTPRGTLVWCVVDKGGLTPRAGVRRIAVLGSLDGDPATAAKLAEHQDCAVLSPPAGAQVVRAWIPVAHPDVWLQARAGRLNDGNRGDRDERQPDGGSDSQQPQRLTFPPRGPAYHTAGEVEAAIVWRFLEWFAPDVVVEVAADDAPEPSSAGANDSALRTNPTTPTLAPPRGEPRRSTDGGASENAPQRSGAGLTAALRAAPAGARLRVNAVRLPAAMLTADPSQFDDATRRRWGIDALSRAGGERSPTAQAAVERLQRSPEAVVARLLEHYGGHLQTVMYQPALAVAARQRFGELTGDPAQRERVRAILEPYLQGDRPAISEQGGGSNLSGHLAFALWASDERLRSRLPDRPAEPAAPESSDRPQSPDDRTSRPVAEPAAAAIDPRAVELVRRAANRGFDDAGQPREAMPTHSEMSDAVFMACPLLTAAGRLTGDPRYIDLAARHLRFMQRLCLRDDGLYRHSPLNAAAWGRGNGFPALGLALALSDLQMILDRPPATDPAGQNLRATADRVHAELLTSFRSHVAALLPHQDPTGAWRQVIDHPGAYRELTATCMIAFAIARGVRAGWLDLAAHQPALDRAWEAIQLRVWDDGVLFDVCTGTGKQRSLQEYLDRTAILGRDERGGAMALLAALELWELRRDAASVEPTP